MQWIATGRRVGSEGTTITYTGYRDGKDSGLRIESRRRHIPHSNRGGTWDHTSYFVIRDGKVLAEKFRLLDAKEYAEEAIV